MTSSTDPKGSKKRTGRKRLPPLAPGPALQFVVASHPDDFKADNTMRNIRSHVMYKHRGEQQRRSGSPADTSKRGSRRSTPLSITRTPSPLTTRSDGNLDESSYSALSVRRRSATWDSEIYRFISQSPTPDPARDIVQRIIAASTADPPRSAPPTFDQGSEFPFPSNLSMDVETLSDLKHLYIDRNEWCHDRAWMEVVCSTPTSFLSNVTANCVYKDVIEGLLEDSPLTIAAKGKVLPMIRDACTFHEARSSSDDLTTLSILHLLISEIGGAAEEVLDFHLSALTRIVGRSGGLQNLGNDGRVATFLAVVLLTISVLRDHSEFTMLRGFSPRCPPSAGPTRLPPISPLFAPQGDLSTLFSRCSNDTYRILCDMHELTRTFIHRWNYPNDAYAQSASHLASYDHHMQQIYTRLLLCQRTDVHGAPDWVYESCRLAALIYCRSIVQGVPFSDSANIVHAPSSSVAFSGVTWIRALHEALVNTDHKGDWGEMHGVFMWICLVGGAASWPPRSQYETHDEDHTITAWSKKWFALFAVKSSLAGGFDHALATTEAQRTMLHVQELIKLKRGIASQ